MLFAASCRPTLQSAAHQRAFQGVPLGRCTIKKWGVKFLLFCTECRGNSVRFGGGGWMNVQKQQIKTVKNDDAALKKKRAGPPFRAKSQRARGK